MKAHDAFGILCVTQWSHESSESPKFQLNWRSIMSVVPDGVVSDVVVSDVVSD